MLSLERYLPILDQKVELQVPELHETRVYLTKVEDISEDFITVICPISSGEVVPLRAGQRVTVTYVTGEGLFSFDTGILERFAGQVPRLKLARPDEIVRAQRRHHKRIEARFPVRYALIESDAIEMGPGTLDFKQAECVDISSGGMRVRLVDVVVGIRLGTYVQLRFSIPTEDRRDFDLMAQVVRIEDFGRAKAPALDAIDTESGPRNSVEEVADPKRNYRVAFRFVDISLSDQDSIMKFVFDRERELIERGVIGR